MNNIAPSQEPAVWVAVVTAILTALGIHLADKQVTQIVTLIIAAVPLFSGILIRFNVVPKSNTVSADLAKLIQQAQTEYDTALVSKIAGLLNTNTAVVSLQNAK